MKEVQLTQKFKNSTVLQLYARAEAPCRDYYGLTISEKSICMNIWRVSHGRHAYPKRVVSDMEDMKSDKFFQEEIKKVFGPNVYEFTMNVVYERWNLGNLPNKIFLMILNYLNRNDILRLSRVSKIYRELCNTETVWFLLFKKMLRRMPSPSEKKMAVDAGWRKVLLNRLAYIQNIYEKRNATSNIKLSIVGREKNLKSIN